MVDVSAKTCTARVAVASGDVEMQSSTANMIRDATAAKGDVLAVARLAAIQSTKWTAHLIPLCHAIPIESVSIEFVWPESARPNTAVLRCIASVQTTAKTGVEMEAMTAVSVACLTVYDMVKSVDRGISIGPLQLLEKSGGKSGRFLRDSD